MSSRTKLENRARRVAGGVSALAAGALFCVAAVAAEESKSAAAVAPPTPESFTAIAMNINSGPGPNTSRATIRVKAWSSDEQRGALLKVLAENGSDALVRALQDQPSIGTLSFQGTLGYDLRYARSIQQGDKRHIVLATDRPVALGELWRNARSLDKGVTLIHLALDANGEGSGELLIGAELSLDAKDHELNIEHLGTNPVKLNQVERSKN